MGFSTDAIHAGNAPDPATGAVSVPIYQTSTYVQEAIGKHKGYEYARTQNPTRAALEENLAVLEKGAGARAFASGMAAITAISTFVKQGEHVVCSNLTYGGTYRYFTKIQARYGVEFSFVDTADADVVRAAMRPNTKLLFLETPTNPMMTLCDIPLLSGIAHERGALVVVDNTFASPYLQRPLELGADFVGALDDEVPERPLRLGRRRRGGEGPRARRVAGLRPERLRRDPLPLRLLARAPRDQDARRADGPPRGERPRDRAVPVASTRRSARPTIPAFRTFRSASSPSVR